MDPVPSVSFSQTIVLIFWPIKCQYIPNYSSRFKVYASEPGGKGGSGIAQFFVDNFGKNPKIKNITSSNR